jgi:hypothetical protein
MTSGARSNHQVRRAPRAGVVSVLAGLRRGVLLLCLPLALLGALLVVMAGPASAVSVGLAQSTFPATVAVGQHGIPVSFSFVNDSTGGNTSDDLALTSATMVPSCGDSGNHADCPLSGRDPGVFSFSSTGVGRLGTACPGVTFALTLTDPAQDKYALQSLASVVLGPANTAAGTCTIDFTMSVVKLPTFDTAPGIAGIQTAQLASVGYHDQSTATNGQSTFAGRTTVTPLSGPYSPLTPVRICDTRPGNPSALNGPAAQCNGAASVGTTIAAGGIKTVNVAGNFAVPPGALAVVLNVTAVNPAAGGFLTIYPSNAAKPFTSNLNYATNEAVPNVVEVGTDESGNVSIFSSAQTDVVVDLEGYVSSTASGGAGSGLYNPLPSPARLCDTRAGNPSSLTGGDAQCNGDANAGTRLVANAKADVQVTTNNGIPIGATAAVLNVTVVNPSVTGYLTIYPKGATRPFTANANFRAGQVTGNRVIVPLSIGGVTPGEISVFSSSAADVVVDVSGYYSAAGGEGTRFSAEAAPVRICDTRAGNPSGLTGGADQCNGATLGPAGTDAINVLGVAGNPFGAKAVVVNLTAVAPSLGTFLTVFPATPRPFASDLNPAAHEVRGNLTVATISAGGTISIYNNTGSADVVVDVLGWYS